MTTNQVAARAVYVVDAGLGKRELGRLARGKGFDIRLGNILVKFRQSKRCGYRMKVVVFDKSVERL